MAMTDSQFRKRLCEMLECARLWQEAEEDDMTDVEQEESRQTVEQWIDAVDEATELLPALKDAAGALRRVKGDPKFSTLYNDVQYIVEAADERAIAAIAKAEGGAA